MCRQSLLCAFTGISCVYYTELYGRRVLVRTECHGHALRSQRCGTFYHRCYIYFVFKLLPSFISSIFPDASQDKMEDPSIRVQVSPSQSAYFAGETFSVTITFTNTRLSTASSPTVSAPAPTHKRNAYSISSAPLARPPTSPGLGPRPQDFVRAVGGEEGRKGLIGNE